MRRPVSIEVHLDDKGRKYISVKSINKVLDECRKVFEEGGKAKLQYYVDEGIPVRDAEKFVKHMTGMVKKYTEAVKHQFKSIDLED